MAPLFLCLYTGMTMTASDYGHWDVSRVGRFVPADWFGFIYEIEHRSTGRVYIGKKQLLAKRQKTKSNKSRYKESNWREYASSSEFVARLIEEYGKEDFHFRIVRLCSGLCELSYAEEAHQFGSDVLCARLDNGERKYLNQTIAHRNFAGLEKQLTESRRKQAALLTETP